MDEEVEEEGLTHLDACGDDGGNDSLPGLLTVPVDGTFCHLLFSFGLLAGKWKLNSSFDVT